MSDQPVENNLETTPPVVENPQNVNQVTPKPGTNWESAYKGLQANYQKLKTEHDQLQVSHNALLADHEKLKQDQIAKDSRMTTLESENVTHKSKLMRTSLLLAEFSDLAGFEKEGLLPTGGADEASLRTVFGKFRDTMKVQVAASAAQQVAGSVPAPSGAVNTTTPSQQTQDEDSVWASMMAHAGDPDQREFLKYRALWDQIHAKKASK